ncbi:MAG: LON peptidase substrate-binding domain-containing protein [Phaeodactylibacter sp.]|nr:LON peptidase substrate-binding domain-containing protein [Phaeodactylibacter sp.]MCB9050235.1 LON peptidase substrate-binding domain-containing protein [Lewinellaceae bacterium]
MDKLLPLFPLQLVVFPGEDLNLHIFEPRYRQLIKECEEEGITFGIPAYIDGKVMTVGAEVRLISIEKRYPNGELDVKTQGIGLFSIKEFYRTAPGKLYSAAEVSPLPHDTEGDVVANTQILELVEELFSLMSIKKSIPSGPNDFNTYELAHHVGFSLEQEYQFLCVADERSRQEFMRMHLEKLIPVVREMENLRKRAEMNGHFKNIIPPEV